MWMSPKSRTIQSHESHEINVYEDLFVKILLLQLKLRNSNNGDCCVMLKLPFLTHWMRGKKNNNFKHCSLISEFYICILNKQTPTPTKNVTERVWKICVLHQSTCLRTFCARRHSWTDSDSGPSFMCTPTEDQYEQECEWVWVKPSQSRCT
jgi:hypothetical protein